MGSERRPPAPVPFDVNRDELRRDFLEVLAPELLVTLSADARPAWGQMSAQQMIEHLTWLYDLSVGTAEAECPVPEERRLPLKAFLSNEQQSPRNLRNPVLTAGLPALRCATISTALADLDVARRRFFGLDPSQRTVAFTHPLLGPLVHDEWERFHFKHVFHHLLQFQLIGAA